MRKLLIASSVDKVGSSDGEGTVWRGSAVVQQWQNDDGVTIWWDSEWRHDKLQASIRRYEPKQLAS